MHIPDIAFKPNLPATSFLEIVDLTDLSDRKHGFDHDPECPHRVNFNILLLVEAGAGRHVIDFVEYPFSAGSVIFVQQRQIHAFDLSQNPKGKLILFTEGFIQELYTRFSLPLFGAVYFQRNYQPILSLDTHSFSRCMKLVSEIHEEVASEQQNNSIAHYLFASTLLLINRGGGSEKEGFWGSVRNDKLVRFSALLERHHGTTRNASDYASMLHITYKTLNQICRREVGKTAKQLIDNYLLLEAKRRLSVDDVPVQNIASALGFDELTNFVKFFKKHLNMTPTQFRKLS